MKLIEKVRGKEIYKDKGKFSNSFIFAVPKDLGPFFNWFPTQKDAHNFLLERRPYRMNGLFFEREEIF